MTNFGAWTTPPRACDYKTQTILDSVKDEFNQRARDGLNGEFVGIIYRTQVVAGTNYLIKVHIAEAEDGYAHLLIWQKLSGQNLLKNYQLKHTKADPLDPFE